MHSFNLFLFVLAISFSSTSCRRTERYNWVLSQTRKSKHNWNYYQDFSTNIEVQSCVSTAPGNSFFADDIPRHSKQNSTIKNFPTYLVRNTSEDFAEITKYELLRSVGCRGINFIQNINISRSYATTEQVRNKCYTRTRYKYVKCSYPSGKEYSFSDWRGYGRCFHNMPYKQGNKSSLQHKNIGINGYLYTTKEIVTFCKQLKSGFRKHGRNREYNRGRRCYTNGCYTKRVNGEVYYKYRGRGYGSGKGHKLLDIVSEFVLEGKLKRYRRQFEITFGRIRQRFRKYHYAIRKKVVKKNGKVHVQFFLHSRFNTGHYREVKN